MSTLGFLGRCLRVVLHDGVISLIRFVIPFKHELCWRREVLYIRQVVGRLMLIVLSECDIGVDFGVGIVVEWLLVGKILGGSFSVVFLRRLDEWASCLRRF